MTLASRLLHASSLFTDSFATPSAMMRKILGRLEFSGPSTMGLLLRRGDNSQWASLHQGRLPLESEEEEEELPFNEVTQEVKRVDSFLFVLFEWQPAEPVGEDLADVDALWPEPHDLPHGGDAVLCGVYVLFGARVAGLDDADQHGDGLWRWETESQPNATLLPINPSIELLQVPPVQYWL